MTAAELDNLLYRVQDAKFVGEVTLTARDAQILFTALKLMRAFKEVGDL